MAKTHDVAEIELSQLQHALKVIAPAIPGASCSMPILRSIRFEQRPAGLTIEATDLDSSMRVVFAATTGLAAPLALPSERLIKYAQLLTGDTITLSGAENRVTVKCGKSRASLPRFEVSQLPIIPPFEPQASAVLFNQPDLSRVLRLVGIAMSHEIDRYTLNGILFEGNGTTFTAVATDGHRMGVYSMPCESQFRFLLPGRMLKLLPPVLVNDKETVSLQETEINIEASVAAEAPVFIAARKLAGQFPNWQAVMPKDFAAELTVEAAAFYRTIERALLFADARSHALKLTFSASEILVHSADASAGEADETVEAGNGPASSITIGFNGDYLADVLKILSGSVIVRIKDAQAAMLITSAVREGETFDYVVMPTRIS